MGKRITIILDDDLPKKLHEIQAKQIKQSIKSVSFSRVLNEVLHKGLK
jgi:predicted transcriptional regulator